jgi:D-glycero-D-manno-heptose 1,7-bisphosphate phosphatase
MKRAVFFDRDNTIIEDVPYNGDADKVTLLQGAVDAMKHCSLLGYELVIITNQSGVGRGYITEQQMNEVNSKVEALLQEAGVFIRKTYSCIHAPDERCICRKPGAGLLKAAADELSISLNQSVMVGDKISDVKAGINAGCGMNILISETEKECNEFIVIRHIKDIVKVIVR